MTPQERQQKLSDIITRDTSLPEYLSSVRLLLGEQNPQFSDSDITAVLDLAALPAHRSTLNAETIHRYTSLEGNELKTVISIALQVGILGKAEADEDSFISDTAIIDALRTLALQTDQD